MVHKRPNHLGVDHRCDRQTDGQKYDSNSVYLMASANKVVETNFVVTMILGIHTMRKLHACHTYNIVTV